MNKKLKLPHTIWPTPALNKSENITAASQACHISPLTLHTRAQINFICAKRGNLAGNENNGHPVRTARARNNAGKIRKYTNMYVYIRPGVYFLSSHQHEWEQAWLGHWFILGSPLKVSAINVIVHVKNTIYKFTYQLCNRWINQIFEFWNPLWLPTKRTIITSESIGLGNQTNWFRVTHP